MPPVATEPIRPAQDAVPDEPSNETAALIEVAGAAETNMVAEQVPEPHPEVVPNKTETPAADRSPEEVPAPAAPPSETAHKDAMAALVEHSKEVSETTSQEAAAALAQHSKEVSAIHTQETAVALAEHSEEVSAITSQEASAALAQHSKEVSANNSQEAVAALAQHSKEVSAVRSQEAAVALAAHSKEVAEATKADALPQDSAGAAVEPTAAPTTVVAAAVADVAVIVWGDEERSVDVNSHVWLALDQLSFDSLPEILDKFTKEVSGVGTPSQEATEEILEPISPTQDNLLPQMPSTSVASGDIEVVIPDDVVPGDTFLVVLDDGRELEVGVPEGCGPGSVILIGTGEQDASPAVVADEEPPVASLGAPPPTSTQPPTPAEPAAAEPAQASTKESETIEIGVTVPVGSKAGDTFNAEWNGRPFEVVVPIGSGAGSLITVQVPLEPDVEDWVVTGSTSSMGQDSAESPKPSKLVVVQEPIPEVPRETSEPAVEPVAEPSETQQPAEATKPPEPPANAAAEQVAEPAPVQEAPEPVAEPAPPSPAEQASSAAPMQRMSELIQKQLHLPVEDGVSLPALASRKLLASKAPVEDRVPESISYMIPAAHVEACPVSRSSVFFHARSDLIDLEHAWYLAISEAHEYSAIQSMLSATSTRQGKLYTPLIPLVLIGVALIYVGTAPARDFSQGEAQAVSKIDFALPAAVSTSLQSIATRSTQDLWGSHAFSLEDATAEQLAQRRANAISKLSKRLTGNVRAKDELGLALQHWCVTIGQHLLGLIGRTRAVCTKIDEDTAQAVQEMNEALVHQPSSTSLDKVSLATASMGMSWTEVQETEIQRIAAALRAFAVVQSPGTAAAGSGPPRTVLPGSGFGEASTALQLTHEHLTTAAAPEHRGYDRHSEASFGFAVENGADPVGEVAVSAEQDAALPLSTDTQAAEVPSETCLQDLHDGLRDVLYRARQFPVVLSKLPQGILEWLFPEQLVEMGGACLGYLPTVADLAHVRFVEGPVIRNELYLLHADDRAHGHLLFLQVCEALGVQASAWHWHRIVETLPSLPPEQYVLLPNSMPWHRVLMPVDLRPLGGSVSLVATERNQPCGNIVADAAAQQQLSIAEQDFLCRTCGAWFVPQAYTSMLPRGDTLQAWPVQRDRASARTEHGGSLSPRLSLEDVFSTSLSLPSPVALAFHEENGANAVVLYTQGLHYTFAPVYADHLSIRSTVMGSFMHEVTSGGLEFSHFARILPPLDRLPAIQFVAMQCTVGQFPGVIDFRPLGGGLVVGAMARDSPPATRLKDAVASYGEPDASTSVMSSLATGSLCVIHRECVVDPYSPLHAAVPAPLVIVRRHQHGVRDELASPPSAGWRPTLSVAVCIGLSNLLGGRGLLFGLFWGASIATFLPPADPLQEGAIPISQEPIDGPPHSPENNLASITEHHKLAQRLQVFGDWEHVDVRCSLGLAHSPHALLRASGAAGRKFPVPVLASMNSRYVAFVAPARANTFWRLLYCSIQDARFVLAKARFSLFAMAMLWLPMPGQLETGLREWYGPTRCGAAGLIRLPVAYPVVDLYCLPCHRFSTLTVLLSDTAECDFRPVVHSVSTGSQEPPELSHITQVPSALRGFWVDVMWRRPVILRHFLLTDSQTRSGQAFLFVHLGLDFCRAYDQGWRISQVHGQSIVWKWPGEVYSLAGECGHLLHDGQDPFVCDASRDTSAAIQHVLQRATTQLPVGSIGLLAGGTGAGAAPRHLSCFRILALLLLSTPFAAGTADVSSPEPEEPSVTPVLDSTPASTLRVNVWSPFQGPSTFDVAKAGPLSTF
ncbi:unnamed protein product [Symbiodinium sp. CCMP2592]|nr:unnamed protein product [Symbiodinium sp. CCMP2592]